MSDKRIEVGERVAYRGKKDCHNVRCTQASWAREQGMCFGWHCPRCDEPCSMMGHTCKGETEEEA